MMARKAAKTRPKVRSELFFTSPCEASCSCMPRSVTVLVLLDCLRAQDGQPSSPSGGSSSPSPGTSLLRNRDLPQDDLGDPLGDDATSCSVQMGRARGEDVAGLILEDRRQIKRFDTLAAEPGLGLAERVQAARQQAGETRHMTVGLLRDIFEIGGHMGIGGAVAVG